MATSTPSVWLRFQEPSVFPRGLLRLLGVGSWALWSQQPLPLQVLEVAPVSPSSPCACLAQGAGLGQVASNVLISSRDKPRRQGVAGTYSWALAGSVGVSSSFCSLNQKGTLNNHGHPFLMGVLGTGE